MEIHGKRKFPVKEKKGKEKKRRNVKFPASGTGAGDLLTSDAVRGGSLVGRPIIPMG
jgi:hypothetical protein